ncbi:MAG TPA: dTDP-4-dehydrorhamnose reductase [Mycobacteriales bacterium]|jgi:dTDP-4-dehydrorhamnose reductase|nr:dTDP-4-dehydrorhamnose reductase [Mycobacteriales bacterium]
MTSAPLRALVVGAGGQLGTDLLTVLGGSARGLTRADLDVTDGAAVRAAVGDWALAVRDRPGPLTIFNAAAWTNVDGAEEAEEAAYAANAAAPAHLAIAAEAAGARLVHVSTDYVFAGDADAPYEVDAPTAPRSAYGRTKLAGEEAVLAASAGAYVVRTAWVYGATGGNFVKTMARLERERETVSVVDDQRGSPTWSADLARGLVALARRAPAPGVYHCTNGGETTWYGFARAVFEELGADPERVRPCTTADFPRPAPRPAYSVLSDRAWREAGLDPLPEWRAALRAAFATAGDALRG